MIAAALVATARDVILLQQPNASAPVSLSRPQA